jgi:hypothetical protein
MENEATRAIVCVKSLKEIGTTNYCQGYDEAHTSDSAYAHEELTGLSQSICQSTSARRDDGAFR